VFERCRPKRSARKGVREREPGGVERSLVAVKAPIIVRFASTTDQSAATTVQALGL
jgi:hypothetical protein